MRISIAFAIAAALVAASLQSTPAAVKKMTEVGKPMGECRDRMCACKDKACADRTSLSESRKKGGANSTNGSGPSRSRK